jgi:hypothetical protein
LSKSIGIDKIALFIPVAEVKIEPHFPAKIHNTENAATGRMTSHQQLFFNGERYLTGQRATYNTDDFQLTIAPDRGGGAPNCILQWSGRVFSGSNEVPLDRERLSDVARRVEVELRDVGLSFPVDKAQLTRVDLAKNVELSQPVAAYTPVFGALQGRKSMNKQDFGGTGFLMGNTQRQVAFYDKGAEMHAKGMELDECPINTVRPEARLMKSHSVCGALGAEKLPDLLRGWEKIPGAYMHAMEQDAFRPKMEKKIGAALDYWEHARYIMDAAYSRKWQACKSDGFALMVVHQMGLEQAKTWAAFEMVEDADSPTGKRQIQRMHAELEQAAFAIKMSESAPDRTPLQQLYQELKRAVLT